MICVLCCLYRKNIFPCIISARGSFVALSAAISFLISPVYKPPLTQYSSSLLRSVISAVMIEKSDDTLYIPSSSLDRDEYGLYVNLINKDELKLLLDNTKVFELSVFAQSFKSV